jgi:hypothetical protein
LTPVAGRSWRVSYPRAGHGMVEVVTFGADPDGGSRQVYRKIVTVPDRHVP